VPQSAQAQPPAPAPAAAPAPAFVEKAPAPAATDKVAKAEPAPAPEKKPEPKAEAKSQQSTADAAKARALLEGKSIDTAAAGLRYVVQVGAFAEKDKARQAQQKLERAGLKNYTQVADTEEGKRIRVRAGPFAS
jgi:DedD protein